MLVRLALLSILVFTSMTGSRAGVNRWTPIGPQGARFSALAVDPAAPDVLYAATSMGVYRSSDRGETWTAANQGLTDLPANALVLDPSDPSVLYLGTDRAGVFKSTDGGASWTPRNEGLTNPRVLALALDPFDPATILAGTPLGVFRSDDAGASWSESNAGLPVPLRVQDFAWDSGSPGLLCAATGPGAYRSLDGGQTWTEAAAGLPLQPVARIAADPEVAGTFYAGTIPTGVFKSVDGCVTWTESLTRIEGLSFFTLSLLAVPSAGQVVYVGTDLGVAASRDGGSTWQAARDGMLGQSVQSLAADPATPSTLYAGTETNFFQAGRLYRSEDAAASWRSFGNGLPERVSAGTVVVDPRSPSTLYATSNGVSRSEDRGASWQGLSVGLTGPIGLFLDPLDPDTLYTGSFRRGVFKSEDRAESWAPSGLDGLLVFKVVPHPARPATVYAATEDGPYRSLDGGGIWHLIRDGLPPTVDDTPDLVIDPSDPDVLYTAHFLGVSRSVDGGDNWSSTPLADNIEVLAIDPLQPSRLYAAGFGSGLFESVDSGASWTPVDDPRLGSVRDLWVEPGGQRRVFAAGLSRILARPLDDADFEEFNNGLDPRLSINGFVGDPTDPNRFYAAGSTSLGGGGVFAFDMDETVRASLTATKTARGVLTQGGQVHYSIRIDNAGPGRQQNNPGDEFRDQLPRDVFLLGAQADTGSLSILRASTTTIGWNGEIPPGGSVNIAIQVRIADVPRPSLNNQGTLLFDPDGDGINEATGLTDDPSQPGPEDPTALVVFAQSVPTLGEFGFAALFLLLLLAGWRMLARH